MAQGVHASWPSLFENSPATHFVQCAAPSSKFTGLENDPFGHFMHVVAGSSSPRKYPLGHGVHFADPSSSAKKPASHFSHFADCSLLNVPASHTSHAVIPSSATNSPARQAPQVLAPSAAEKDPARHSVHLSEPSEPLKLPALHSVHNVAFLPREEVPGGQALQSDAYAAPILVAMCPPSQTIGDSHFFAPILEKVPAGHGEHFSAPSASEK